MKRAFKALLRVLEGLTYFVPDVVLVLAIASIFYFDFGTYANLITISLFIAYIGLIFGDHYYRKVVASRELLVNEVLRQVEEFDSYMKGSKFITLDRLINFAGIIEDEVNIKIDELRDELTKGRIANEVDKEKQL